MYQRSMANMFASDNGLRIYTGFEKNLRKLIEKTAGKDAAKCSGRIPHDYTEQSREEGRSGQVSDGASEAGMTS